MSAHVHDHPRTAPEPGFWRSRGCLVFIAFAAIAAAYLLFEHSAHVVQYLPFGVVLLCPLMHVFMHRGHHGHGGRSGGRPHGDSP